MAQEHGKVASFAKATEITIIDSHTYGADFYEDWCIGSVPNGGYVGSCFQQVAAKHFATTHKKQDQPHTMAMHLSFARRTEVGPATFIVKDVKIGRATSTVHISLVQHDHEEVLCYLVQSNLVKAEGVTFSTEWSLPPPAPLPVDISRLEAGSDPNWFEQTKMPFRSFRKATNRVRLCFPRGGQTSKAITEQWMCFADGKHFTTESLGFVADTFAHVVESLQGNDTYYTEPGQLQQGNDKASASFWYPTVLLNLDVKKALPEAGVKWLFSRVSAKSVKNGRFDLEVVILDAEGDLVALSHHVVMALSASRNTAARTRKLEGGSKI